MQVSTREKALAVNLDLSRYGTFAEIGAGQEVVRWFFQAGGAAGTISKSISAYDMKVSDAIYGTCQRYVCRERLESMLDAEQGLNLERLTSHRGESTGFFTFADTVSARNYHGTNECHGWMGISFQRNPGAAESRIIIHVRMLDGANSLQQEALGIVGVNLIHGAFYHSDNSESFIRGLLDGLSTQRIEIDVVDFSGDGFEHVDNRVISLQLVQLGLTGAAMFAADGSVLQPSAVLRKRPLLIERGRFRPVTHVNLDMLEAAREEFIAGHEVEADAVLPIMEITMRNLTHEGDVCLADFVSRAEVLATTGHIVMVSDFFEYHRLAAYLYRYTHAPIGLAMGLATLESLFQEEYSEDLDGGLLESFGRLFKNQLQLLIYPMRDDTGTGVRGLTEIKVPPTMRPLFDYLNARGCIVPLSTTNHELLDIHSPQVLAEIASGENSWESKVPPSVAEAIKSKALFGYGGQA